MALNGARKTLTDGRTGHVDLLAFREHFGREGHAGLELGDLIGIDMELFEHRTGFDASLGVVTGQSLVDARGLLGAERDLDCIVAVGFNRLHHRDTVIRHVEHGHGNGHTVFRENTRHADLATDEAELITHCFLHPGCDWPGPFFWEIAQGRFGKEETTSSRAQRRDFSRDLFHPATQIAGNFTVKIKLLTGP